MKKLNKKAALVFNTLISRMNGDLVPDPDMTFAVSKVLDDYIVPMTYQDMYNYKEGIFID